MWNNSVGQGVAPAAVPNVIEITFSNRDSLWITGALYQWDTGQALHFNDGFPDGTEVQFGRRSGGETVNRVIEGGYVRIPDVCLQSTDNLICWVVVVGEDHQTTVKRVQLDVKKRSKPADYVAAEDEQTFREWVQGRINQTSNDLAAYQQRVIEYFEQLKKLIDGGGTSAEIIALLDTAILDLAVLS